MDGQLDIGEVVERSGVPASTLHLWERRGLIAPVGRRGLRRQYHPDSLRTIALIVFCQHGGFTLDEISDLFEPDAFDDGKRLLEDKVAELRRLRRDLDRAIAGLEHAIDCPNPSPFECPRIDPHLEAVLPARRHQHRGVLR